MRHLKRAEEQLKANKNVELVKQSLALHYEEVDKNKFYEDMAIKYYELFPSTREMTDVEKSKRYNEYQSNCDLDDIGYSERIPIDEFIYAQVDIDYSEVEDYVTFEEYRNETRVVTEAIEEVVELDKEGFEVIVQPYVAEVTELVRPFVAKDNYDEEVNGYLDGVGYYEEVKVANKVESLSKLKVTTASGKVFYADTEARIDLQAAIDGANLKGLASTYWKLAEEFEGSRIVEVSLDEIREASALALEAKAGLVGVTNA